MLRRRNSPLGGILFHLYRWRTMRRTVRWLLERLEGGIMLSGTLRRIYQSHEGVTIGEFSRGAGIQPGLFADGTVIGNFSCFAGGLKVFRRNHAIQRPSQHPLFFNRILGLLKEDSIPHYADNPLIIGSDVWIGMNVIICPGCSRIGDGAIIGAGSVVTRDVPPFSIHAGNPARLIRKRFEPEVERVLVASKWWLRPPQELVAHMDLFLQDITPRSCRNFAMAFPPTDDGGAPSS